MLNSISINPLRGTFRYIESFKTKRYIFQRISQFYSHTLVANGFFILEFLITIILPFYLQIFPPQETSKISELLYTDIVYTILLDAIAAFYDIKCVKDLFKVDEKLQQYSNNKLRYQQ